MFPGFFSFILLAWWITFVDLGVLNKTPLPLGADVLFFLYISGNHVACGQHILGGASLSSLRISTFYVKCLFHLHLTQLLRWFVFHLLFVFCLLHFFCFSLPPFLPSFVLIECFLEFCCNFSVVLQLFVLLCFVCVVDVGITIHILNFLIFLKLMLSPFM